MILRITNSERQNKKTGALGGTAWTGIRFMYIPKGISDKTSSRIGFLFGGKPGSKLSYEIGYYHDFSSMPISDVFNSSSVSYTHLTLPTILLV